MHLPGVIVITVAGTQIWLGCVVLPVSEHGVLLPVLPIHPNQEAYREGLCLAPERRGSNPLLALIYTWPASVVITSLLISCPVALFL